MLNNRPPPVLVAVAPPARQRRATVAFRLILAVPHYFVLFFLSIAAQVVAIVGWWAALFAGRLPEFAVTLLGGVLRWSARVSAYYSLLTDCYPPFTLDDDPGYPVRVAIPPRQRLNRAAVFFRLILQIPAEIVVSVVSFGALTLVGFIAWLITLIAGRLPAPLHQAYSVVLRYQTRFYGYLLMLTPAYPGGLFGDVPGAPTWADAPQEAQPPGLGSFAGRPDFQPAGWLLVVSAGARRLVRTFVVLGVLLLACYIVLVVAVISAGVSDVTMARESLTQLDTAGSTLSAEFTEYENALTACGISFTCATTQDGKAAGYFDAFARQLRRLPLPPDSRAAGARLEREATENAMYFSELSKATTETQYYESSIADGGQQALTNDFNDDYNALVSELEHG